MMKINWENRSEINSLYIHDSTFEGLVYDYANRQILLKCINYYAKKKFDIIFENVIFCNIQSCNFWGEGKNILVIYLDDDEVQLKKFIEIQNSNSHDYNGSKLAQNVKYIQVGIDINSGDQIFIGCECVEYNESSF